jgi:pantetheine-phosphate adenylyltransferase
VAVFAGSFDPITAGHVDLVLRALAFADRVVVAVSVNASKQPLFSLDERAAMARDALASEPRVEVAALDGLLVAFARRVGATLLIRGLRTGGDFDYELGMAQMNRHVAPAVDTVFLAPVAGAGLRELDARARGVAPRRRRRRPRAAGRRAGAAGRFAPR